MLVAEELALEVIRDVRPILERVRKRDPSLFDQGRRAGNSMVLNIAEGRGSDGGNARARYSTAAGSSQELSAALKLAVAWGYVRAEVVEPIEPKLDRVRRLLWSLRH